jgi:hypothetical protein
MDKIFSARISESVIRRIGLLAQRLQMSKKAIVEKAISEFAERVDAAAENDDFLTESFGAWRRAESPDKIQREAKKRFQSSMERHHQ